MARAQEQRPGNRYRVVVDKKWGYIDQTGKVVIEPQFEIVDDFREGFAIVENIKTIFKFGFIDESGNFFDFRQYDNLGRYSEGLAAVGKGIFGLHRGGDHKWGFIDRSGKLVIEITYRDYKDFSEGLAAVMNDEQKWGYIDKTGTLAIPFQFDDAFEFSEGLACVLSNGLFGFVDNSGRFVIPPRFARPGRFQEGLAAVEIATENFKAKRYYESYYSSGGRIAFVDKTGSEAVKLPPNTVTIDDFSEGLARVDIKIGGSPAYTGFIDKSGRMAFRLPFYSGSGRFSEGLAVVRRNDRFGYIDKTGRVVIPIRYRWAEDFHSGLAVVSTSQQIWDRKGLGKSLFFEPNRGYIDKSGKIIWKPRN